MNDALWGPGDRVMVRLPDRNAISGRANAWQWFPGTVREIDPPGICPGVRVDLDYPVNGAQDCYATHAELCAWSDHHPDYDKGVE